MNRKDTYYCEIGMLSGESEQSDYLIFSTLYRGEREQLDLAGMYFTVSRILVPLYVSISTAELKVLS